MIEGTAYMGDVVAVGLAFKPTSLIVITFCFKEAGGSSLFARFLFATFPDLLVMSISRSGRPSVFSPPTAISGEPCPNAGPIGSHGTQAA